MATPKTREEERAEFQAFLEKLTIPQQLGFLLGLTWYCLRTFFFCWEISYLLPFYQLFAPPEAILDYLRSRLISNREFIRKGVEKRYLEPHRLEKWDDICDRYL